MMSNFETGGLHWRIEPDDDGWPLVDLLVEEDTGDGRRELVLLTSLKAGHARELAAALMAAVDEVEGEGSEG
jgi:hypothetical protein